MTDPVQPEIGAIGWIDLTVDNAEEIREFYSAVTGWASSPVDMGGYSDFNMIPPKGRLPVAGICHARGGNADLPAAWLVYITVEDVDASAQACTELGGEVLAQPRNLGDMGRFCVIQDPAGAVAALFAYNP